jgi:hypothetical protein
MIRPESLTRMNNKAGAQADRDSHDLNWQAKETRNAKAAEISDTILDHSNLANHYLLKYTGQTGLIDSKQASIYARTQSDNTLFGRGLRTCQ